MTMASIQKRDNGRWRARYRDVAGKEHARHFDRKTDAQRWLDHVTASVVRGEYVDPKAGRITLATYAQQWEAIQVSAESTKRIVDNALRLHILPELGDMPLAAVRRSNVQSFVKHLESKGLAAGTIRGIYHVLTQVFGAAVDDRLISSTPCRRITLPEGADTEVIPPTIEEVEAYLTAFDPRWRGLVVLLAGAGPRIGEALGLDVYDVNFLGRSVRIDRQRTQQNQIKPPKSKKSRRTVPVGSVVTDTLAAHLAAYPSDGALFVDEIGQPLTYRRWRTLSEGAAKQSGVEIGAHDLRHFYASALIAGGASVKQVQERLGHSSPVITLQTYSHLWPGDDDRTRDVIDAALASLSTRTAIGGFGA